MSPFSTSSRLGMLMWRGARVSTCDSRRSQSWPSRRTSCRTCFRFTPAEKPEGKWLGDLLTVQKVALDARPALLERDGRADLVEHLECRRDTGLDGVGAEDSLREGVQRADGGEVELVERSLCPRHDTGVELLRDHLLETRAKTVAQLGASLDGERDGGDVLHGDAVNEHEVGNPIDEGACLA